eukprot:1491492-Prymnesium_polylepis.1
MLVTTCDQIPQQQSPVQWLPGGTPPPTRHSIAQDDFGGAEGGYAAVGRHPGAEEADAAADGRHRPALHRERALVARHGREADEG